MKGNARFLKTCNLSIVEKCVFHGKFSDSAALDGLSHSSMVGQVNKMDGFEKRQPGGSLREIW